jgi:lipoate-protein ligase A
LPLFGDLARVIDYLAFPADERLAQRQRLYHRAVTLKEAAGTRYSFERVARTLAQGFAAALNLHLAPGELTLQEHALAAELREARYTDPGWTARL